MKFLLRFLCAVVLISATAADSDTPSLHVSFDRYVKVMKAINDSPYLRDEWQKHLNLFRGDPVLGSIRRGQRYAALTCDGYQLKSSVVPSSVHKLRVGDINIVAAMGDSLTAANGASAWTVLGCLTEYRGEAWSIGGDGDYTRGNFQLPNIMKQFNPDIIGYSTGTGDRDSSRAGFNVARAGDVAQDMPVQAQMLVERLRTDSRVDFEKDWKMVTLFIGGNNLCAYCEDWNSHSPDAYKNEIELALDYLYTNLPRVFVNLVEIFDITPVTDLATGPICNLVHGAVCDCGHGNNVDRAALSQLSQDYQRVVQELVESRKYDNREDFAVVNQPFLRETAPPLSASGSPDMSYFAPDCFHFSEKGHNVAGKALWNNIIKPMNEKSVEWGVNEPAGCPETPYIPTRYN